MTTGAKIEFQNVGKFYGAVQALKGFNLTIEPGEFLTILGASGSGKSTVLNSLAGFSPADEGDILIEGKSVVNCQPEKRNLGMVFQNYSLFPHMSVFDNVAFPLRMKKVPKNLVKDRVDRVMDTVRLGAFADRMPRELSGGQQQRVAVARAIACEPSVLLMDEPLGALDLKLREALQFEIKEIQRALGCTVVYVTHDQREALAMSTRIVILRDGRIEQMGTPSEIYDLPKNRFIADFIGQTNLLEAKVSRNGLVAIKHLGIEFTTASKWGETEKCYVSIRPEKIERRCAEADDIEFSVKINEMVFLGDVIEYSAKHETGATFYFQEKRGSVENIAERDSVVSVVFRPQDAVLVADS